MSSVQVLSPVSNDGASTIDASHPYTVSVTIEGSAPVLFHRWSVEAVAEKAAAKKGSKAKKSDDVESYVYRCDDGTIGIPAEYLRMAIVGAAKFRQDPRSPRKSAMDLYKAAVLPLTELASTGKQTWDYLDQRRVMVQRNGITRSRPALAKGWRVSFEFMVQIPEYVDHESLLDTIGAAGRFVGIGDFRPTYGRFNVVGFEVVR